MDWGRAKTILIAILLMLNAVLAGTIVSRATGSGADDRIYRDVAQILENRGISMQCEFPKNIRSSAMLVYEGGASRAALMAQALASYAGVAYAVLGEEGEALAAGGSGKRVELVGSESIRYACDFPTEALPMGSEEPLGDALRDALSGMGIDMSQFALDSVKWHRADAGEDGGATARFVQVYQGSLVFDSYISVRVTPDGGIAEVAARLRGIRGLSPNKPMKVAPAYQVILRHYSKSGQAIRSIDIGFMGQSAASGDAFIESEEGAVWRVRLAEGSDRYFEASYGDEVFMDDL